MDQLESKKQLRKYINTLFHGKHRQHYLKWVLTDPDWSIRYFWVMDSRPKYVNHWVLKSHKSKEYIILSQSEALDFIRFRAISRNPVEVHGVLSDKYHKQIIQH